MQQKDDFVMTVCVIKRICIFELTSQLFRLSVLNHVFHSDVGCNSDSDCQYHSCSSVETPVCSHGICHCKGLFVNNNE